VYSLMSGCK